jgi:hypothetical protein
MILGPAESEHGVASTIVRLGGSRESGEEGLESRGSVLTSQPSKLRAQSIATKLYGPKPIQTKPFFFSSQTKPTHLVSSLIFNPFILNLLRNRPIKTNLN